MILRLLCLLICLTSIASAAPELEPTREQAKAHYLAGKALKEKGDFEGAIREYQTAYDLAPNPELLYNLGLVYRLAGQPQRALDSFQKYLAASPNGRGSAKAREYVQELSAIPAPPSQPEASPPVAAAPPAVPVEPAPTPARPQRGRWVAPAITIAGLVMAATGAGLLGSVAAYANDHDSCIKLGTCPVSETHTQKALAEAGYALSAIGGVVALGGAIAWGATWRHSRAHASLQPMGAGLKVVGAF